MRADNATRSLRCLVQVDAEGWDIERRLWDASETVLVAQAASKAAPTQEASADASSGWGISSGGYASQSELRR
ncbi:hypothetical protein ACFY2M_39850 [Streptomyces sp. NPDC001276]|uniref:hypothetical protein n=1 Tax=Streptomyces sp. NPDC001276 TaxID=3364555 RepID=UPI0036B1FEAD